MATAIKLLDNMIEELEVLLRDHSQLSAPASEVVKSEPVASQDSKESEVVKDVKPLNTKEKKEPKSKEAANKPKAAEPVDGPININSIDLRVGIIRNVYKHETADKLYCEEIDVGEESPRAIASGLVKHYSLEQMQGRALIVVCNLKPRNLVGFKSNGMVLCAARTNEDGTEVVELLSPPADAKPGDRIVGESLPLHAPMTASQCDKKKAFETVASQLKMVDGFATWNGVRLVTLDGKPLTAATLHNDAVIR